MKPFVFQLPERNNTRRCTGIAAAAMLFVILFANAAFCDVVDDSLPSDSPPAVKDSARHVTRSGLQQDEVIKLTRAMLQNKFNEQQIQQAHALMIEAKTNGMPVEPIMNKAFEGMAKGVEPARIVSAMEAVQSRNAFSYQLAAQLSKNDSQKTNLGNILSSAFAAGFTKADAEKIKQMIRERAKSKKLRKGP